MVSFQTYIYLLIILQDPFSQINGKLTNSYLKGGVRLKIYKHSKNYFSQKRLLIINLRKRILGNDEDINISLTRVTSPKYMLKIPFSPGDQGRLVWSVGLTRLTCLLACCPFIQYVLS